MDLLNAAKQNLKIHESPSKGVWISDLTEEVKNTFKIIFVYCLVVCYL